MLVCQEKISHLDKQKLCYPLSLTRDKEEVDFKGQLRENYDRHGYMLMVNSLTPVTYFFN